MTQAEDQNGRYRDRDADSYVVCVTAGASAASILCVLRGARRGTIDRGVAVSKHIVLCDAGVATAQLNALCLPN